MQQEPMRAPVDETRGGFFTARVKMLMGGVAVLLVVGYLAFTAFPGSATFYLTIQELQEQGATPPDRTVRVMGALVPSSYERDPVTAVAAFSLQDEEGRVINASYSGAVPDLFFNPHSEVILDGRYDGSGHFDTRSVVVKCPTKYQKLDPSEYGDGYVPEGYETGPSAS